MNCVELEFIMIHANFHDHRTISSVEKIFEGFYHIFLYEHEYHLGTVTLTIYILRLPKEATHQIWDWLSHFQDL